MRLARTREEDRLWMDEALREARRASEEREVPVGAVVVAEGRLIGRGHNQVERLKDPTAHAEIIALGAAAGAVGTWKLHGCTLYVTLEPCPMCAGALMLARIDRLVFGAHDPRAGACGSRTDLLRDGMFDCSIEVCSGVGAEEASDLMRGFFERLRGNSGT